MRWTCYRVPYRFSLCSNPFLQKIHHPFLLFNFVWQASHWKNRRHQKKRVMWKVTAFSLSEGSLLHPFRIISQLHSHFIYPLPKWQRNLKWQKIPSKWLIAVYPYACPPLFSRIWNKNQTTLGKMQVCSGKIHTILWMHLLSECHVHLCLPSEYRQFWWRNHSPMRAS